MTTNEENVHLILYEFKLQDIECPDDKISSSDYGNHLVKSLGDILECTFKSIMVTGYRKVLSISLSSFQKMYLKLNTNSSQLLQYYHVSFAIS